MNEYDNLIQGRADDFIQRLRVQLADWIQSEQGRRYSHARYLLWVPDLFGLLLRLLLDDRVPAAERGLLVSALVYVVNADDFFPESEVGPVGYVDDAVVLAVVLQHTLAAVPPGTVEEHWNGSEWVVEVLAQILSEAEQMLGSTLWRRIQGWVAGEGPKAG